MNIIPHKARIVLDGKAINGYTVSIEATSPDDVCGKLIDTSGKNRRDLPFCIKAKEEEFGVPATVTDLFEKFFPDYIKYDALAPTQVTLHRCVSYP